MAEGTVGIDEDDDGVEESNVKAIENHADFNKLMVREITDHALETNFWPQ